MLLNNEMVLSFCQYKPTPCVEVKPKENCLLLQLRDCNDIIIVQDFLVLNRVTSSQPFTLDSQQFLPGFDIETLPFVICNSSHQSGKSETIDLLSVKTGKITALVNVSAHNLQY